MGNIDNPRSGGGDMRVIYVVIGCREEDHDGS
jgi:hypothetical protein